MKYLAQFNIGKLKYGPEDSRLADFINNVERVNAVAERSDGFVWRLKTETYDPVVIHGIHDPAIIPNLSVWENAGSLEKFVWQTVHKKIYNRKGEWFEPSLQPTFVMWWVDPGHEPSIAEAIERLEYLRTCGPSDYAFGWAELPGIELFKSRQCA